MTIETNTSPEAVAAMIAELRHRSTADDMCGNCFDEERASAADLVAALSAERDEARATIKQQGVVALAKWKELLNEIHTVKAERDALTERCERAERERDNIAKENRHNAKYCLVYLEQTERLETDLAAARATIADATEQIHLLRGQISADTRLMAGKDATIARLTREKAEAVEAEREACAVIADGMTEWDTPRLKRIGVIIRARASKGTET